LAPSLSLFVSGLESAEALFRHFEGFLPRFTPDMDMVNDTAPTMIAIRTMK